MAQAEFDALVVRQAEGGFSQPGFGFQRSIGYLAPRRIEEADNRDVGAEFLYPLFLFQPAEVLGIVGRVEAVAVRAFFA